MSRTARTTSCALAVVGAASAVLVASPGPAYADSYTPTLDATNWYWASKRLAPAPAPVPAAPADTPDQASNIPAGDLGVAYTTATDKVAALMIGLASVPIGATFNDFTLKMHIDGTPTSVTPGSLQACELLDVFTDAPGPSSYSSVPTASSATCTNGVWDAGTSSYTFVLTTLANDWAGGTPVSGVLVQPATGTTPFNYAFDKKSIVMSATYTAPVKAPVTAPVAPAAVPPAAPGVVSFPQSQPQVQPALPLPAVVVLPAPAPAPAPAPQTAP
ncbi:MAG: hypothetical protein M3N21_09300, partial [Actinomycetota bacterium]|nr:hypothetical protein [Actinomycetota bacterium]